MGGYLDMTLATPYQNRRVPRRRVGAERLALRTST
jgi:hypothetical protein